MLDIYLAARYGRREELCEYCEALEARGYHVTSRWLNGEHEAFDNDHARFEQFAFEDIEDLLAADTCISFTDGPDVEDWVRGGRHVEFGMACALMKDSIVVGPRENAFHFLSAVVHYANFSDLLKEIEETHTDATA